MQSPVGNRPILLAGSGRSGTTFAAKLIDSHPDILLRYEPDKALRTDAIPYLPPDHPDPEMIRNAAEYLDKLLRSGNATASGSRPFFRKSYRGRLAELVHRGWSTTARALDRVAGLPVPDLARGTTPRYLMKTVSSLWRTRLLKLARPDLVVVHLVRHPCAVVASRLRGISLGRMPGDVFLDAIFSAGRGGNFGFDKQTLEGKTIEEQMAFAWMAINQQVYDDMHQHDDYRLVIYEDLCSDLPAQMHSLFEFLDLEENAQTASFVNELQGLGDTSRYFSVRRSPTSALTKWQQELDAEQIAAVREIVSASELGRRFTSNPTSG
ncbi:MAG: sulfotransferase [Gammaproteobacteria bacterium]|nr:sulfotransferase [Gammaproteobacteria bacterium]